MKPLTLALTAIAATTIAQSWPPYYDVQSSGFRLILKSDNNTLDGYALGACHQGAAIEGLCLTGETVDEPTSYYTTFYHNISSSQNEPINFVDTLGVLTYILHAGGGLEVPSAMQFIQNPGSNLADLIISPGYEKFTTMAFAECGSAYIPVWNDDTVSPPSTYNPPLQLKNWYICLTKYSYQYTTLVWKYGIKGEPQNPSCEPVEILRVWI